MRSKPKTPDDDAAAVETATAFLVQRGIPANAREFRLRQEFYRHGWDLRVREENRLWSVHAVKKSRQDAQATSAAEASALRLALAQALRHDDPAGSS